MSFIRLKRRIVAGKDVYYAYLVKNTWKKKISSPRQKVSRYLGRVYEPEKKEEIDFFEFIKKEPEVYASESTRNKIISDLVRWELKKHDADFSVSRAKVSKDGREVVLKLNEGYMCRHTLNRLYNFSTKEDDPHYIGVNLATRFTDAGIRIPKQLFVLVFDKFAGSPY